MAESRSYKRKIAPEAYKNDKEDFIEDYGNRGERLNSSLLKQKADGVFQSCCEFMGRFLRALGTRVVNVTRPAVSADCPFLNLGFCPFTETGRQGSHDS